MARAPLWRLSSPESAEKRPSSIVNLSNRRLFSIPSSISSSVTKLILQNNPIHSLAGLPVLPHLVKLRLDSTQLASLEGAVDQPSLVSISFVNTPLWKLRAHRVMAACAFHPHLRKVNDVPLTQSEKAFCEFNHSSLRPELFAGWLIVSFSPAKLLHPRTRIRRNVCFKAATTAQPKESDGWDDGGGIELSAGEDWMAESVQSDVPALGSESALLLGERGPVVPGGADEDDETESWMRIEDDGTVPPIGSESALFLGVKRSVPRDEDETAAWARVTDIGSVPPLASESAAMLHPKAQPMKRFADSDSDE